MSDNQKLGTKLVSSLTSSSPRLLFSLEPERLIVLITELCLQLSLHFSETYQGNDGKEKWPQRD